jgi:hypothetical protein
MYSCLWIALCDYLFLKQVEPALIYFRMSTRMCILCTLTLIMHIQLIKAPYISEVSSLAIFHGFCLVCPFVCYTGDLCCPLFRHTRNRRFVLSLPRIFMILGYLQHLCVCVGRHATLSLSRERGVPRFIHRPLCSPLLTCNDCVHRIGSLYTNPNVEIVSFSHDESDNENANATLCLCSPSFKQERTETEVAESGWLIELDRQKIQHWSREPACLLKTQKVAWSCELEKKREQ